MPGGKMRGSWSWVLAYMLLGAGGVAFAAPLSVAGGRVSVPELNAPDRIAEEDGEQEDRYDRQDREASDDKPRVRFASLQESVADEPLAPQVMDEPTIDDGGYQPSGCQSGRCGRCQQCCSARPLSGFWGRGVSILVCPRPGYTAAGHNLPSGYSSGGSRTVARFERAVRRLADQRSRALRRSIHAGLLVRSGRDLRR